MTLGRVGGFVVGRERMQVERIGREADRVGGDLAVPDGTRIEPFQARDVARFAHVDRIGIPSDARVLEAGEVRAQPSDEMRRLGFHERTGARTIRRYQSVDAEHVDRVDRDRAAVFVAEVQVAHQDVG